MSFVQSVFHCGRTQVAPPNLGSVLRRFTNQKRRKAFSIRGFRVPFGFNIA